MCNNLTTQLGVQLLSYLQINTEFLVLYYRVFVYLDMEKDIVSIVKEGQFGVFYSFSCHNILYDTGGSHQNTWMEECKQSKFQQGFNVLIGVHLFQNIDGALNSFSLHVPWILSTYFDLKELNANCFLLMVVFYGVSHVNSRY